MNALRAVNVGPRNRVTAPASDAMGRVRQEISIQRLLEWAFADEFASVDFEDSGTLAQGYGAQGNAHLMLERGKLGCRIDGGGRSSPHPDADLVAAAVAVLPIGCGGRGMAVQIAELVRARRVPDAMVGRHASCMPVGMRENQHGRQAVTEVIGTGIDLSGRKLKRYDILICPVTYTLSAGEVARARRNYLLWRSALLELRQTFVTYNNMSRWTIVDTLPPVRPWAKSI